MGLLRLAVLGPPEVLHNGSRLTFALRKAQALLLYLAVEGGMHPRSKLATLLWPDSEPPDARKTLRNAITLLRSQLTDASPAPHSHLLAEQELLGLDPHAPLELDLDVVQLAWKQAQGLSAETVALAEHVRATAAALRGTSPARPATATAGSQPPSELVAPLIGRAAAFSRLVGGFQQALLQEHQPLQTMLSAAEVEHLYVSLGWTYAFQNAWQQAQDAYKELLASARQKPLPTLVSMTLNRLAVLAVQQSKDKLQMRALLEEARQRAEASQDQRVLAETEWNLAQITATFWEDPTSAFPHGQQVLSLARGIQDKELEARSLALLG
jgi:hypothetical protein